MNFNIRMGIPEMQELWLDLQEKYRSGNIKKKEEQLYKKWGKALKLLSADPGLSLIHIFLNNFANRRFASMTRVIIFIPAVVSLTAIGLLWVIAYNPSIG